MSITPKAIQDLLDELEASRNSRKRAWEILQEIRYVLRDIAGIEARQPARKTIDLEGRIVKEAVRSGLEDRHKALTNLISAIREYRKFSEQPLTLRGSEYAHAVQELNKAIDRAEPSRMVFHVRTIQRDDFRRRTCSAVSYPDSTATRSPVAFLRNIQELSTFFTLWQRRNATPLIWDDFASLSQGSARCLL
jgi:hypothetical protein